MKKYSQKQLKEAINFWKNELKKLNESGYPEYYDEAEEDLDDDVVDAIRRETTENSDYSDELPPENIDYLDELLHESNDLADDFIHDVFLAYNKIDISDINKFTMVTAITKALNSYPVLDYYLVRNDTGDLEKVKKMLEKSGKTIDNEKNLKDVTINDINGIILGKEFDPFSSADDDEDPEPNEPY